jgi:hypothetical protein
LTGIAVIVCEIFPEGPPYVVEILIIATVVALMEGRIFALRRERDQAIHELTAT